MNIDVVIGNPPYQEETGAGTVVTGKKPIYQEFILNSLSWCDSYICMIIPSRWVMNGIGLKQMYNAFEDLSSHIRYIVDYMSWDNAIFGDKVQIAGGVMYFLIDKNYEGDCEYTNIDKANISKLKRRLLFTPTFIRNNELVSICHKVQELKEDTLIDMCRTNTFGLESFCRGTEIGETELLTSSGWYRIQRDKISCGIGSVDKYKLAISGTTPGGGASGIKGMYKVLASIIPLNKGQICTNTYITIGNFDTEDELVNIMGYLKTKFVRALIFATVSSMHIIPYSFTYVPIPKGKCTDEQLYNKYNLSTKEINYIEKTIKAWR